MADISWKHFEKAVAQFLKAIDPTANVEHDVKKLDIHTKTPRQRDVWLKVKVCNHFPIKIFISCKKYKRKLNQQDIDAFNGEFISSGAQVGVIYSFSGFGDKALQKGKKLDLHCCSLFIDQPADLPKEICLINSYCSTPDLTLHVLAPLDPLWKIETWNDIFKEKVNVNEVSVPLIDSIVESYHSAEKEAIHRANEMFFPPPWSITWTMEDDEKIKSPLKVLLLGKWSVYKGSLSAQLINGSYNFSSGGFVGSVSTPTLDRHQMHPGKDWKLITELPTQEKLCTVPLRTMFFKTIGRLRETLLESYGPKKVISKKIIKNNNV